MSVYTGSGDKGKVRYPFGQLDKFHPFVELLGHIDEVGANIGMLMTQLGDFPQVKVQCSEILKDLYAISADLSMDKVNEYFDLRRYKLLEQWIDEMEKALPPFRRLIMPIGHRATCQAHITRSVVRRAERKYFEVLSQMKISEDAAVYLNRLSDYFFTVARLVNDYYGIDASY